MAHLLEPWAPPPFDIWDNTGKYENIRDRLGKSLSDDQLMALCDRFWGISQYAQVDLFIDGKQMLTRNKYNDRGDLGSRLGLKKSLESMGLLIELRKAPSLIATRNPKEYTVAHWATTLEALYMAYADEANEGNKMIQ